MYTKILVPLDGLKFADSSLPLALTLSRKTGAVVHLVTVLEPIPSFAYDEWESAAKEWCEEYLQNVLERVSGSAGGAVTTSLQTGHVVDTLEREAEAGIADLVVMATHGHGILSTRPQSAARNISRGAQNACDAEAYGSRRRSS